MAIVARMSAADIALAIWRTMNICLTFCLLIKQGDLLYQF